MALMNFFLISNTIWCKSCVVAMARREAIALYLLLYILTSYFHSWHNETNRKKKCFNAIFISEKKF